MIEGFGVQTEKSPNYIRNINLAVAPPIEDMKRELDKTSYKEAKDNEMTMEENHKFVKKTVRNYCDLFNRNGIDYYLVGAVPCYLKLELPFERFHEDIDFMINEEDVEKVKLLFEDTDYDFIDNRFPTADEYKEAVENKNTSVLMAKNRNTNFHIDFYPFYREKDNGITLKEYNHRMLGDSLNTYIILRFYDPVGTELRYSNDVCVCNGIKCKMSSIENIYDLKSYTRRPKDLVDMDKFETAIDKNKLKEIRRHTNRKDIIRDVNSEKMAL